MDNLTLFHLVAYHGFSFLVHQIGFLRSRVARCSPATGLVGCRLLAGIQPGPYRGSIYFGQVDLNFRVAEVIARPLGVDLQLEVLKRASNLQLDGWIIVGDCLQYLQLQRFVAKANGLSLCQKGVEKSTVRAS